MTLKAKCKDCTWKVRAEGSVYLHLCMESHRNNTGHRVKLKGKK
ncbi:hypothetical protein SEA_CHARM_77 [Mycobacterium phage Charm]|nr:hypothetical protein SEA_CHARM_77 [Mycobacterium phage Charm]QGJ88354.1 hypothetical protein SEA_DREAMTEAM1_77 [Mycobacterium phage DreamTeam1]